MNTTFHRILIRAALLTWGLLHPATAEAYGETPMQGTVYGLIFWADTPGAAWTPREKFAGATNVGAAQNWLQEQAARYGVNVNFENGLFGYYESLRLDLSDDGRELGQPMELRSRLLRLVGAEGQDLRAYSARGKRLGYVLVFVKRPLRSYATNVCGERDGCRLLNGVTVIFNPQASVVAHEVGHVFGAQDLYQEKTQRWAKSRIAEAAFPNDIMLSGLRPLPQQEVGPFTAWLLGWDQNPAPWYPAYAASER